MGDRLATGIAALDRELEGGLPTGRVVLLTAPADSQAELLVSRIANGPDTAYLSSERPASSVRSAMETTDVSVDELTVYDVGTDTPILDSIRYLRESIDQELVVVDPVDALEGGGRDQYREFLVALGRQMDATDATALLYALDEPSTPTARTLTAYMADVVLNLETTVRDGTVYNRLTVPKYRGGAAFEESMRLELTERVGVDTSRDIA